MKLHHLCLLLLSACASPLSDVTISPLDFGAVEPQRAHHGTLRVTNVGSTSARLLRVERQSGPASFVVTPAQVGLAPGDASTWQVAFTAGDLGRAEARFVAVFDTGSTSFLVRALVAPPCSVEPFDVGDARVGGSTSARLTLHNPLADPAEVFVGAPPEPFSAERTGTIRLSARETRELDVRFAPSSAGVIERPWLIAPRTDCTATSTSLRGRAVDAPLVFVPGRLHFGDLAPGDESVRTVEVQNRTRAPLRLLSASSDSPQFVLLTALPIEVPADASVSLSVRARSNGTATQSATFRFTTDAAMQAEVRLPALLNYTGRCVSWSRDRIEFGAVELDCRSAEERITLSNACPHPVELSRPVLPPGFALISTTGRVLGAGATDQLQLVFAPGSAGEGTGVLQLDANVFDGAEPIRIALSGTASPRTVVEESKVIPQDDLRRDVLLVIDDAPRMLPHERVVSQNLGQFARTFPAGLYDTRFAVMSTSTTPGVAGRLRKTATGAPFVENPTPAALQELGRVKGEGTGRQSCLEALRTALTSPLRTDPTELGGFLRPNVMLWVVCIINGRDELESPAAETISTILQSLPATHTVAVVGRFHELPWASCGTPIDPGPLRALVTASNGGLEEFCTPNWAPFDRIGKGDFGWSVDVLVQGAPAFERAPLRVALDGLDYPPTDPDIGSRIWEWNPILNAVRFEPLYAPEPGRRVTVRYTPACALR